MHFREMFLENTTQVATKIHHSLLKPIYFFLHLALSRNNSLKNELVSLYFWIWFISHRITLWSLNRQMPSEMEVQLCFKLFIHCLQSLHCLHCFQCLHCLHCLHGLHCSKAYAVYTVHHTVKIFYIVYPVYTVETFYIVYTGYTVYTVCTF